MKSTLVIAALSCCVGIAAEGQNVISFNYDAYAAVSGAAATAGVVPAAYWNDSYILDSNAGNGNSTYSSLLDNSGAATTLSLTTAAFGVYQIQGSDPGLDGDGTYNRRMLNGYINAGSSVTPTTTSFALSSIPYATYDIYVYFTSDTANRTGTVSDGATTYDFSTMGPAEISSANALFTQTTDTGGSNPLADYAIFPGLSGASQTITAGIANFGGLAGIQIVAVPEPGAMTLTIMGGIGLLVLVRRKSKCAH